MSANKSSNIWVGNNSDKINFQNVKNIFVGNIKENLSSLISGQSNIFIGNKNNNFSLLGDYNIHIGEDCGKGGNYNIVLGHNSGLNTIRGDNNIFIGQNSAYKNLTGHSNVFIGYNSGYNNQHSFGNVFIGNEAGYYENNSNSLHIANSKVKIPLIFGRFDRKYVRINSVLALVPTSEPYEIAGGITFNGIKFRGFDGTNWFDFSTSLDVSYLSCGVYSTPPPYVDNLDGTIDLPTCEATLVATPDFTGDIKKYTIPAVSNLSLTDLETNYVIINYNSGTPIYQVTLNVDDINESNIIPVYTIYRSGNELHFLDWDRLGTGLVNKIHHRLVKTQRFAYESGLMLTEPTNGFINISLGSVFMGAVKVKLDEFDSSNVLHQWCFWYHESGNWKVSRQEGVQYKNMYYDNGTDLVEMTNNNRYTILWIFRGIEDHEHGAYILHNSEFKSLALAREAITVPPTNAFIATHMMLVGRLIIRKNASSGFVESSFSSQFIGAPINIHNELAELQGGSHVFDTFYHSDQPINTTDDVEFNSITLGPGTTTKAPLKFVSGDLLSNLSIGGVIEHQEDDYYASIQNPNSYSGLPFYPPENSFIYVKSTNNVGAFYPHKATDLTSSLVGPYDGWIGLSQPQRFHIDLGNAILINSVYYENGHYAGGDTWLGVKNFTMWGSNDASDFNDLTYANDGTWVQLNTNVSQFEEHIALDQPDPKYVYVTNTVAYRYYAFKFADNWGNPYGYWHLRRIVLQFSGQIYRMGIVLNNGTKLTETYLPVATTNGRIQDSIAKQVGSKIEIEGDIKASNLSGTNTGDQNSHELLDDLQGGAPATNEFYHLTEEESYTTESPDVGVITRTLGSISQVELGYVKAPNKVIDITYHLDGRIDFIEKTQGVYYSKTTLVYDVDNNIIGFIKT